MSVEEFNKHIDDMKAFVQLVLKIALYSLQNSNPAAQQIYDSFFPSSHQNKKHSAVHQGLNEQ